METGEEEEITYFSSKAKLFNFLNGEWKERGIGTFKLNGRKSSTDPEKIFSRMIMRADGNMRVMLNSSLFRGMNYGDSKNECPTTKQIILAGVENGRTVPLLLRVSHITNSSIAVYAATNPPYSSQAWKQPRGSGRKSGNASRTYLARMKRMTR